MMLACETTDFQNTVTPANTLGQKISAQILALGQERQVNQKMHLTSIEAQYEEMRRELINQIVFDGIQKIDLARAANEMVQQESLFLHVAMPFDITKSRRYLIEPMASSIDVKPLYIQGFTAIYPVGMPEFCELIENTMAFQSLKLKAKKEDLHVALQVFPVISQNGKNRVIKPLPGFHMPKTTLVVTISAQKIEDPCQIARRDIPHRYDGNPVIDAITLACSFQQIKQQLRKAG